MVIFLYEFRQKRFENIVLDELIIVSFCYNKLDMVAVELAIKIVLYKIKLEFVDSGLTMNFMTF